MQIPQASSIFAQVNNELSNNRHIAKKVTELVSEIAAMSHEQAQGTSQITMSVAEMDKVVQHTAAITEESASASEEMNAQAEQMRNIVIELTCLVDGTTNGNVFKSAQEREDGKMKFLIPGHKKNPSGSHQRDEVKTGMGL